MPTHIKIRFSTGNDEAKLMNIVDIHVAENPGHDIVNIAFVGKVKHAIVTINSNDLRRILPELIRQAQFGEKDG